jgi:DNA-binding NtrC family response regulator
MREAVGLAERVSSTDANVLVTGESGAGKDLLASFIHSQSRRAAQPYVKIDCSTLPGELLEAELFGYERGAFTGAVEGRAGRFEAAQKGTIVLDEIAHLSTDAQAKLLRVIETREFERLGGRKTIKLDARLIALTNVDVEAAVKAGRFREDLFYRLNVIHIRVPALRERRQDLLKLIQYFLKQYAAKHARKVERVAPAALELLQAYDYPGNARELANIVERAVIVAAGPSIEESDLPVGLSAAVKAQQRKAQPRS